ncbi:hypothetical protein GGF46_005168 [Coemansia sp. RSA 552]|nr:hypothetical protein GGF46_005168 [Coemansia sp. RSA 552]
MVQLEIILARHGQTAANADAILQGGRLNPPLNECGKKQAVTLAEAMKYQKLDWIITSGMTRAIETANAVAKYHDAPFVSDSRLNEVSWGELDGAKFADINNTVHSVTSSWAHGDFDAKIKGGESANEAQKRILAAFTDILKTACERQYHRILVCIHGRIMRVIMATLIDKDLCKMQRFTHTNCSYHQIRTELGGSGDPDPEKLKFVPIRIDVRDHLKMLGKVEPSICCSL